MVDEQESGARGKPAKVAFILIDGVGDVTLLQLARRTPLQVAHTPFLDAVAAAGLNGLMDPVEPGRACGSDTAHMSVFGYEPRLYYRGRGAYESMGAGLDMVPGDIAFKCNFAHMDNETGLVKKRRVDRGFPEWGLELCPAIDGLTLPSFPDVMVRVKWATEHRCGVVVRGAGLTDAIEGTDPLKDDLPLRRSQPLNGSPEAAHTAAVVNAVSDEIRRVLSAHPINVARRARGEPDANVVLLRGCGVRLALTPFHERHGMRAVCIAPTKIIAGMAMCIGMDRREVEGATGYYDSAFHNKSRAVAQALAEDGYDFCFCHVKAVDDTGHDRLWHMKVEFLEVVDSMLGQVVRRLWDAEKRSGQRHVLCCTGDHSTPVVFGDHSHEPVPLAMARLSDVVDALGGDAVLQQHGLGPIPVPDHRAPPNVAELAARARWQEERRAAAQSRRPWVGGHAGCPPSHQGNTMVPWPQTVVWDEVSCFNELSAGHGALGRMPGCELMPLIKQLAGVR